MSHYIETLFTKAYEKKRAPEDSNNRCSKTETRRGLVVVGHRDGCEAKGSIKLVFNLFFLSR
jgi:hypothetical protein